MATLSKATQDAITAAVAAAIAAALPTAITAAPTAPSEASAHWKSRDIACGVKGCTRTFRTAKGRDWHVANVKHA